jgi:hypothetical protein
MPACARRRAWRGQVDCHPGRGPGDRPGVPSPGREPGESRHDRGRLPELPTPLRDAEPVLRQMLIEHGIAVSGPETGVADQFPAALRAFGSSAIDIGRALRNLLPPATGLERAGPYPARPDPPAQRTGPSHYPRRPGRNHPAPSTNGTRGELGVVPLPAWRHPLKGQGFSDGRDAQEVRPGLPGGAAGWSGRPALPAARRRSAGPYRSLQRMVDVASGMNSHGESDGYW